jgi:hypothetical protein
MALKPCRECGAEISTAATTCPHCGMKSPTRQPIGCLRPLGFAVVIIVGIMLLAKVSDQQKQATPTTPVDPVRQREDAAANMAGAVLKAFKNSMKDPDSFELKSLIVHPSGTACYEYRATNSFNAHIAGAAVLTPKGKFLTQEQNGNAFVAAWNKGCTPADGEDMTEVAKVWLRF